MTSRARTLRWVHRTGSFDLTRPLVMGILNVTPDSFSDGGQHLDPAVAVARAAAMVEEGADLIDVGGESTRPGARTVPPEEEMARVLPVLSLLRSRVSVPICIDTRRARVARSALEEGADIVNDISALADPEMAAVVANSGVGIVLMHMRGKPATMQLDPRYDDVVGEVARSLTERVEVALAAGVERDRIVIDPGIGFGKTAEHNIELIRSLDRLSNVGPPILLGISRKAFLGQLLGGVPAAERVTATAAGCVVALLAGVRIFRVHDVAVVRQALTVAEALRPLASGT